MKRYIRSNTDIQYRVYEVFYNVDDDCYEEGDCIGTSQDFNNAVDIASDCMRVNHLNCHIVQFDGNSYTEVVWSSY